ncbi:MAG: hypothetical protein N2504_07210 [candidate division WOR-3 bacterium]|nr:hypothetical protein [candidate division WOR-3 bacterium]MCX7948356.1 hypothetical protein [candidate division WOR-3 bacterium]MDW8151257.1 CpsB/CapC family capsule biosynthesis tyrosine phosphatase [candidate division WOR-3 bacterium]
MFDFHIHILPNVDDGSRSIDESVMIIEFLKKNRFIGAVATPHANSLYYPPREKLNKLKEEISKLVEFKILVGYEVRIDAIEIYDPKIFSIENTNLILLEFSISKRPNDILQPFLKVLKHGLRPILAHPERYEYLSIDEILKLKSDLEVIIQVNLKSLLGVYGERIKKRAIQIYEFSDLVGSDIHSIEECKDLKDFELYKNRDFLRIIQHNPSL